MIKSFSIKLLYYFIVLLSFLFLTIFALNIHPYHEGLEGNAYRGYADSIISDGDLNIVNQVGKDDRWLVTKSYNHPGTQDHGLAILYLPVFLYEKIVEYSHGRIKNYQIPQTLITLFLGILTLFITFNIGSRFLPKKIVLLSMFCIGIGTPYLWYFLINPINSDIPATFMASLIVFYYLTFFKKERVDLISYLVMGALLGIGIVVKVSLLFYLPLLISLGIKNRKESNKIVTMILGLFSVAILFFTNEYLKFGELTYGALWQTNFNYNVLWETLFSPNGYLYISPIFILCIISIFFMFREYRKGEVTYKPFLLLVILPIIKLVAESFSYVEGENLGARHFIVDFSIWVVLFGYLINRLEAKKRYILYVLTPFAILWNLMMYLWYFENSCTWGDRYLQYISNLSKPLEYFIYNFKQIFINIYDHIGTVLPYLPIVLIIASIIYCLVFLKIDEKILGKYIIPIFSVSIFVLYSVVTLLNVVNNKKNVEKMQMQGVYNGGVVVSDGMKLNLYDENVGTIYRSLYFAVANKNKKSIQLKVDVLRKYLKEAVVEIKEDTIGLRDNILNRSFKMPLSEVVHPYCASKVQKNYQKIFKIFSRQDDHKLPPPLDGYSYKERVKLNEVMMSGKFDLLNDEFVDNGQKITVKYLGKNDVLGIDNIELLAPENSNNSNIIYYKFRERNFNKIYNYLNKYWNTRKKVIKRDRKITVYYYLDSEISDPILECWLEKNSKDECRLFTLEFLRPYLFRDEY